jgi:hypothetical protein
MKYNQNLKKSQKSLEPTRHSLLFLPCVSPVEELGIMLALVFIAQ